MRAAVAERDAEPLRVAVDDVGAHLAGRREQHTAEQIGPDRDADTGALGPADELPQVVHAAGLIRRLDDRPEDAIVERRRVVVADHELDAERFGARAQHLDGLRKAGVGNEELRRAHRAVRPFRDAVQHRHRLAGGGRFVEQRGVGDLHPGQIADHRLEIEQRFEPALGDLGLVGRTAYHPGFSRTLRRMTLGVIVS